MKHLQDEELSASELRFKYALEKEEDVSSAIEAALQREQEFFGVGLEMDFGSSDRIPDLCATGGKGGSGESQIWSFDDEEGVEADLVNGVHKSFVYRHHSMDERRLERGGVGEAGATAEKIMTDVEPDSTLLFGLDPFMTPQEQQFLTYLMTSGDTTKLAAATELMHYISALSLQGIMPNLKRQRSGVGRSMLESLREVIREGNEARMAEQEREARHSAGVMARHLVDGVKGLAGEKRIQKKRVDFEMRRQMEYMEWHPLPVRMPKYAELRAYNKANHSFALEFLDDVWDGTVLDAFSKICVNKGLLGNVTVTKRYAESKGIRNIIDVGSPKSRGKGYIDTPKPRVLVASMTNEGGQQGIVKGDVVTHFNGEEFAGTASELAAAIGSKQEGELLTFAFNADRAVAEALRRRSLIVSNH